KRRQDRCRVDPGRLMWFIGFLEGRLLTEPPDWWVKGIVRAEAFGRDNVVFPESKALLYHTTRHDLVVPRDTTVEDRDGKVKITTGNESIVIPLQQFDKIVLDNGFTRLSPCFGSHRCYLAAYTGIDIAQGELFCLERPTGKILWRTLLWLGGDGGAWS